MEIALFGGSFDPPHVGHLLAAAYVLATEPVDELWFVPVAGHPLDLLEHLHRKYPDRQWALVLGSDLATERPQWKRFDRIEQLARIIPLERAGFPVEGQPEGLLPEVSSSQVRAMLASGAAVSHLVPRAVLRAIREAGTYR